MTRMPLGFPSIDVITGIGGRLSSSDWWNEINESTLWQDGIFYALCAAYALVSSIALIQLIRIELRVPEYGWTTQKVFHLMNFIVNGVRAVVFGFHKQVFLLHPKINLRHWNILRNFGALSKKPRKRKNMLEGIAMQDQHEIDSGSFLNQVSILVLLDLPGLLFFSTYTLLVLFWAEIYHQASESTSCYGANIDSSIGIDGQARSLPTDKLRIVYVSVNAGMYLIQACIWVYLWIDDNSVVEFIGKIFIAVVSFMAALGFLVYGGRLFFMLRRFPIESKGRRKKLHEVGSVTGICFTCFLVRCFVVVLSAFDTDASLDVLDHPVLNFIYYMLVEILPSALVLYILRKLPPKRISAQYHPI
ncbi:hypothetical protein RJ640_005568, partial [Escallonia rubra]